VFKGGTSLSKVFGVIERFSEDIDLSLSPVFLKLPEAGTSRNQANKWMARAEAACSEAVQKQIGPAMEAAVTGILGHPGEGEKAWFEFLMDANTNSPVFCCFITRPRSQRGSITSNGPSNWSSARSPTNSQLAGIRCGRG
jgi:hypothetical protein